MPPVTAIGKSGVSMKEEALSDGVIPINNAEYDRMLSKQQEALNINTIDEKSITALNKLKIADTISSKPPSSGNLHKSSSIRETVKNNEFTNNLANESRQSQLKPSSGAPRKVVIQASTSELLQCLGEFICHRCHKFLELEPSVVTSWLRGVDRSLLMQGWQDISFIMPSSVVFIYLLCREMITDNMNSVYEIQATVLTCLYMSYSYMGNEISYPLRPFLIEPDRFKFWARCCKIMDKLSGKMLRINKEAQYFTSVFRELKLYGSTNVRPKYPVRPAAAPHLPRNHISVKQHYPQQIGRIAMVAGAGR